MDLLSQLRALLQPAPYGIGRQGDFEIQQPQQGSVSMAPRNQYGIQQPADPRIMQPTPQLRPAPVRGVGYDPNYRPRHWKNMGSHMLQNTNAGAVMDIADEGGAISPQVQIGSAIRPIQGGGPSYRGIGNSMQGGEMGLLDRLRRPQQKRIR